MKLSVRRQLPLIFYWGYVVFVMMALYFGPMQYVDIGFVGVTAYIGVVTLFFSFGYIYGSSGKIEGPSIRANQYRELVGSPKVKKFLKCLLFAGVICILDVWGSFFIKGQSFSLSSLGQNYLDVYSGYVRGQASIDIGYIKNILSGTVISLCLFFGAYYYEGATKAQRFLFIFIIGSNLLVQVAASGKQKFLGDVVICAMAFFAFQRARALYFIKIKVFLLICLGCVITLFLFLEVLRQRYAAADIGAHNISEYMHPLIYWDLDSAVFSILGDEYGFSLGVFLGYFTNGVYGLYLCLQLPFEWTYFIGNSYSLSRIVEIFVGDNGAISSMTYPVKAGEFFGWDASKWHSLYSWLASDVTFYGVPILALFFGGVYGRLWIEAINARTLASGPLFVIFTLGLVFSLANNQLMHSLSGVVSLLFVLLLWLLYDRRISSCR